MAIHVVILAAGVGSRLGRPHPKPLTPLASGSTILERALDLLGARFDKHSVHLVVGFKKDLVMEAVPDVGFIYNPLYGDTNTSKSLLKALQVLGPGGVLWLNGDVVFHEQVLDEILPLIAMDRSFVCVDTASVGDEEVKYTLDELGRIERLSKGIGEEALGEAVGINYISATDRAVLAKHLAQVGDQDFFERGLERAIELDGLEVAAVDVSAHPVIEVDVIGDLDRVNLTF